MKYRVCDRCGCLILTTAKHAIARRSGTRKPKRPPRAARRKNRVQKLVDGDPRCPHCAHAAYCGGHAGDYCPNFQNRKQAARIAERMERERWARYRENEGRTK